MVNTTSVLMFYDGDCEDTVSHVFSPSTKFESIVKFVEEMVKEDEMTVLVKENKLYLVDMDGEQDNSFYYVETNQYIDIP